MVVVGYGELGDFGGMEAAVAGLGVEQLVDAKNRRTPIFSSDGHELGHVEDFFLDDETQVPEWVAVGTGFMRTKRVLVPVANAHVSADGLYVSYTKQQVEGTPDTDSDHISRETERRLYEHYELGKVGVSAEDELTVIRSEERVSVGTEATETGRVRLRKWVETEPVQTQVKAHRESARIEYEPVGLPVSGVELGEQEIDIPLLVQEPMLEKQVVAKERVRLRKAVETGHEQVSDEVREERIDVDEETFER